MTSLRLIAVGMAVSCVGFGFNSSVAFGQQKSSFSQKVKSGFAKMTGSLTPEPTVIEPKDSISLSVEATTEPGLFVAMARHKEQTGDLPGTDSLYQRALESDPENLNAILSYAQFNDRQNRLEEAIKLYQKAAEIAPDNPSVMNDLGICYARRNMLKESVLAMQEAIRLQPDRPLYHNNIATVYAGLGNSERALAHLKQVHPEPAAYYNLGYLLQRGEKRQEAIRYFSEALARDPSMTEAKAWLEKLGARLPNAPIQTNRQPESRPVHSPGPSLSAPTAETLPQTPLALAPSTPEYPPMPPMPPTPKSGTVARDVTQSHPNIRPLPPVHRVDPPSPIAKPPTGSRHPLGGPRVIQSPSSSLPVVHPLPPVR